MHGSRIEVWGGIECTINRIGDAYLHQLALTGHDRREADLDLVSRTGIRVLRYPVLWESVAPKGIAHADWSWVDARLSRLASLGVEPIVGLLHHGSGPPHTNLLDPSFPRKLAEYAGAVATRYPTIKRYTPVNEPLTTARFSGLYGCWYPHGRADRTFVRALYHQCLGTALAMRAIRDVNPAAELVQTEDAARTYGPRALQYQVDFENERRWLSLDLLEGRVDEHHFLWKYLLKSGLAAADLAVMRDLRCPPDLIGLNYYVTSDRLLDTRLDLYPRRYHGGNERHRYADVEAVRARAEGIYGHRQVLLDAWARYHRPVALTEVHLGATPEEQVEWLNEAWKGCQEASTVAEVRAMTVWSLLGCVDWDSLVTRRRGHYEPGVFDVRGSTPRPTALFRAVEHITRTGVARAGVKGQGWWRRKSRLWYGPASLPKQSGQRVRSRERQRPLLILGATGILGQAFAKVCAHRELPHRTFTHAELDATDLEGVRTQIELLRPWAVVNATDFVGVDDAELEPADCERVNTLGPATLASACSATGVGLVTFSSDLVFDGTADHAYLESSHPCPLSFYGRSKAAAELRVSMLMPQALIVRTSAFFGPWDDSNFLTRTMRSLRAGRPVSAACDLVVSPTYVPELVETSLNLLLDGASGLWHIANVGAATWAEFARAGARLAGLDPKLIDARPAASMGYRASRPARVVLATERGTLMTTLERALERYYKDCNGVEPRP